ncbi:hypothetical protein G5V59_07500 [Nocardioides sp. W3-2-3]|uniref:hypothetical protein n=1 Tax=Nocardioides convexus TaxID=2712224 RepID=UPI002418B839|nr:hypothetical protein [Nocardioides convexus]NHA00083.1 hypothetical protein [Nocardioides convexus]
MPPSGSDRGRRLRLRLLRRRGGLPADAGGLAALRDGDLHLPGGGDGTGLRGAQHLRPAGRRDSTAGWVGGAIILGAFVWMGVQIALATTARIPAFETPASRPSEGGAR